MEFDRNELEEIYSLFSHWNEDFPMPESFHNILNKTEIMLARIDEKETSGPIID
jgi:hypothetical protein